MDKSFKDQLLESLSHKADKIRHTKTWLRSPAPTKLLETTQYIADKHGALFHLSADHYSAYISLTLKDLSGLKDEGLAALLDAFVCSNPDWTDSRDDAASFARIYTFYWYGTDFDGFRPTMVITVTANFRQDSETCHRVITGYTEAKTVEPQPIYKLDCEKQEEVANGPV